MLVLDAVAAVIYALLVTCRLLLHSLVLGNDSQQRHRGPDKDVTFLALNMRRDSRETTPPASSMNASLPTIRRLAAASSAPGKTPPVVLSGEQLVLRGATMAVSTNSPRGGARLSGGTVEDPDTEVARVTGSPVRGLAHNSADGRFPSVTPPSDGPRDGGDADGGATTAGDDGRVVVRVATSHGPHRPRRRRPVSARARMPAGTAPTPPGGRADDTSTATHAARARRHTRVRPSSAHATPAVVDGEHTPGGQGSGTTADMGSSARVSPTLAVHRVRDRGKGALQLAGAHNSVATASAVPVAVHPRLLGKPPDIAPPSDAEIRRAAVSLRQQLAVKHAAQMQADFVLATKRATPTVVSRQTLRSSGPGSACQVKTPAAAAAAAAVGATTGAAAASRPAIVKYNQHGVVSLTAHIPGFPARAEFVPDGGGGGGGSGDGGVEAALVGDGGWDPGVSMWHASTTSRPDGGDASFANLHNRSPADAPHHTGEPRVTNMTASAFRVSQPSQPNRGQHHRKPSKAASATKAGDQGGDVEDSPAVPTVGAAPATGAKPTMDHVQRQAWHHNGGMRTLLLAAPVAAPSGGGAGGVATVSAPGDAAHPDLALAPPASASLASRRRRRRHRPHVRPGGDPSVALHMMIAQRRAAAAGRVTQGAGRFMELTAGGGDATSLAIGPHRNPRRRKRRRKRRGRHRGDGDGGESDESEAELVVMSEESSSDSEHPDFFGSEAAVGVTRPRVVTPKPLAATARELQERYKGGIARIAQRNKVRRAVLSPLLSSLPAAHHSVCVCDSVCVCVCECDVWMCQAHRAGTAPALGRNHRTRGRASEVASALPWKGEAEANMARHRPHDARQVFAAVWQQHAQPRGRGDVVGPPVAHNGDGGSPAWMQQLTGWRHNTTTSHGPSAPNQPATRRSVRPRPVSRGRIVTQPGMHTQGVGTIMTPMEARLRATIGMLKAATSSDA